MYQHVTTAGTISPLDIRDSYGIIDGVRLYIIVTRLVTRHIVNSRDIRHVLPQPATSHNVIQSADSSLTRIKQIAA